MAVEYLLHAPSAGLIKLNDASPLTSSTLTTEAKVIDGNKGTAIASFCSAPDSWGVDLGSAKEITKVIFYFYTFSSGKVAFHVNDNLNSLFV